MSSTVKTTDSYVRGKTRYHRAGFTLIELIVSIGIMTLIGGAVVLFQRNILTGTKTLQSELIAQQQVRKALTGFVSHIRGATFAASGAFTIDTAGTSTIIFYSNIDGDAAVERVRYFLATTTLKMGVIKPVGTTYATATEQISTVVNDVANATSTPIFTYYDGFYDGVTASSSDPLPQPVNIPSIRLIQMSLTVNPNGVRAPVMQTYTTRASIRNLKDNL